MEFNFNEVTREITVKMNEEEAWIITNAVRFSSKELLLFVENPLDSYYIIHKEFIENMTKNYNSVEVENGGNDEM